MQYQMKMLDVAMPSLDSLPAEVHRTIISYMDISSLGALSCTQRPRDGNLSSSSSDDSTWFSLVQRRFGIGCSRKRQSSKEGVVLVRRFSSSSLIDSNLSSARKKRPMSYGGSTWKEAYRSLSTTRRIPETSYTSSTVFASPSKYRFQNSGNRTAYLKLSKNYAVDYLGVWSLVNHSQNCHTKSVTSSSFYDAHRRYLEVKVCLQNTKSGYGCIVIPDIRRIRFVTVNEEKCYTSCGCDDTSCDDCAPSFPIVKHGQWAPKVLHRTRFNGCDCKEKDVGSNEISLHPLECVVLSIHVSCPPEMVYETDVLSTLSSIQVPVVPSTGWQVKQSECSLRTSFATAFFLPEELVWEYYTQLPGGCLSLVDRSRLIPV